MAFGLISRNISNKLSLRTIKHVSKQAQICREWAEIVKCLKRTVLPTGLADGSKAANAYVYNLQFSYHLVQLLIYRIAVYLPLADQVQLYGEQDQASCVYASL